MPKQGPEWANILIWLFRESMKVIFQITQHYGICYGIIKNYVEIYHQVDCGFELLARTQSVETTEGLCQAHARNILRGMKVGVSHCSTLIMLPGNILLWDMGWTVSIVTINICMDT